MNTFRPPFSSFKNYVPMRNPVRLAEEEKIDVWTLEDFFLVYIELIELVISIYNVFIRWFSSFFVLDVLSSSL